MTVILALACGAGLSVGLSAGFTTLALNAVPKRQR